MWLLTKLIFAVTVTSALAFLCPKRCKCSNGDEREYWCSVGDGHVKYNAGINHYVNIECMGTNFSCPDLPSVNFANNLTLPYLGVKGCSPTILQCVRDTFQTSSVAMVTFTNPVEVFDEEDVVDLGGVESLTINNASDDTVPVLAIKPLRSLRRLRICRSQLNLYSNAFEGAPPLTFLELSEDGLTEIPDDAFNGLSELKHLSVWGNNISVIGDNAFRGLGSLELLTLNTNQLSTIEPGALTHTPQLKCLKLYQNQLKQLPEQLTRNLTQLENITIQYNAVALTLQSKSLSNLRSLINLNLESNKIMSLPDDLLTGSDALQKLSLSDNEIASIPVNFFESQKFLTDLDLSHNNISFLTSGIFAPLKQLETLNLDHNNLEVLTDVLFSGLSKLNFISINSNKITTISESAFQGATGLSILSLASNKLTLKPHQIEFSDQINDFYLSEYMNVLDQSPFKTLTQLRELILAGNRIDTIYEDWTTVLLNLQKLDLSRNQFSELNWYNIQFLSQNITVDLRYNQISIVRLQSGSESPSDSESPIDSESPSNSESPRGSLLLENNPLTCDCGVYNLAMRLRGAKTTSVEPKFIVGNARCSSPPNLEDELFKNVSPFDLNCDLPNGTCDSNCSICQFKPASSELDLTCATLPSKLPNPSDFGGKTISLKLQKSPEHNIGNLAVQMLNLSNIGLEEVSFKPSESIKVLDLSNNNLKTIPMDLLESNITLYLSNNSLRCDCWDSQEITAIQKSIFIADLESVTCKTGDYDYYIVQLDVLALCSSWNAAAVAGGTFVVLVLIVTISALTIYRYSHEILIYITNKGLFPCCFIEDLTDSNKEYDIFVSYAHKDRQFFLQLLSKLENDFQQKTCVHYRDWYVGDLIPDQIHRSVENSRKTIILLSGNFLDSAYANMEFNAAHNLALKEGKSRVILILLEDVSSHEKLSDELKAYIKTNTYLSWDDPRFWERLHKVLPRKNNKKFVWPDVFGQTGGNKGGDRVKSGLDVHINSQGQLVNVAVKDMV